jgi:ElaB/YqjD/DUF883 family membrane-anchored ribosome-binding protein
MGLPAPQNLTPAKTTFTDDEIIDAANAAMSGGPALTPAQKVRLDAIRQRQGLGPVNAPVADGSAGGGGGVSRSDLDNIAGAMSNMSSGAPGATTPGATAPGTSAGGSAGDGQTAMATTMILPQIARMVGTQYSDDLITIIDTAMSVLQRSAPTAYREKLMQLRGQTSGKKLEPAADQIARVKNKKKKGASGAPAAADAPPATRPLGPTRVASNNPGAPTDAERAKFDQRVAQATAIGSDLTPNPPGAELAMQDLDNFDLMNRSARAESRKVFGGKYIKESADAKIARDFEKFVMAME